MFKTMRAEGLRHPADREQPALRGDCIDTYDAFCLLGASRLWGEAGPQAISVSEIIKVGKELLGISALDDLMSFVRLIKRMDQVEMKYHNSRKKT